MRVASLLLGMFFLIVSIGCADNDTQRPGGEASPPLIAFNSERDGNFEIYTVRVDGTDLRRLTDTAAH